MTVRKLHRCLLTACGRLAATARRWEATEQAARTPYALARRSLQAVRPAVAAHLERHLAYHAVLRAARCHAHRKRENIRLLQQPALAAQSPARALGARRSLGLLSAAHVKHDSACFRSRCGPQSQGITQCGAGCPCVAQALHLGFVLRHLAMPRHKGRSRLVEPQAALCQVLSLNGGPQAASRVLVRLAGTRCTWRLRAISQHWRPRSPSNCLQPVARAEGGRAVLARVAAWPAAAPALLMRFGKEQGLQMQAACLSCALWCVGTARARAGQAEGCAPCRAGRGRIQDGARRCARPRRRPRRAPGARRLCRCAGGGRA